MKKIMMAIIGIITAAAMCSAIPIPTSVFGTIEGGDFTVRLTIANETAILHEIETQTAEGNYVIVFATNGIKMVNIDMKVYWSSVLMFNMTYDHIETGSKLNVNLSFEPDEPVEVVDVENPGSGGGGGGSSGGGGTNEPTYKDIPRLMEELNVTNITLPEGIEPYQPPEKNTTEETGNETEKEPVVDLPNITAKQNPLFILATIILAILLVIMMLNERAKRE